MPFPDVYEPLAEVPQSGLVTVDTEDINAVGRLVNNMQDKASSYMMLCDTFGISKLQVYIGRKRVSATMPTEAYIDTWLTVKDNAGNDITGAWTDPNVSIHLSAVDLAHEYRLTPSLTALKATLGIHASHPLTWSIVELSTDGTSARIRVYFEPTQYQQSDVVFALDTMALVKTTALTETGIGNPIELLNGEFTLCTQRYGLSVATSLGLAMLRDKPTSWGTIGLVEANEWDSAHSVSLYKEFTSLTETNAVCSLYANPVTFIHPAAEVYDCVFIPYTYIPGLDSSQTWDIAEIIDKAFSFNSYVYPTPMMAQPTALQASYGDMCQDFLYDESYYGLGRSISIRVQYNTFLLSQALVKTLPAQQAAFGLFLQFIDSDGLPISVDGSYRPSEMSLDLWDTDTSGGLSDVQTTTDASGIYTYLVKSSVSTATLSAAVPSGTVSVRVGFIGGFWNKRTDAAHPELRSPGVYGGAYIYNVQAGVL